MKTRYFQINDRIFQLQKIPPKTAEERPYYLVSIADNSGFLGVIPFFTRNGAINAILNYAEVLK